MARDGHSDDSEVTAGWDEVMQARKPRRAGSAPPSPHHSDRHSHSQTPGLFRRSSPPFQPLPEQPPSPSSESYSTPPPFVPPIQSSSSSTFAVQSDRRPSQLDFDPLEFGSTALPVSTPTPSFWSRLRINVGTFSVIAMVTLGATQLFFSVLYDNGHLTTKDKCYELGFFFIVFFAIYSMIKFLGCPE